MRTRTCTNTQTIRMRLPTSIGVLSVPLTESDVRQVEPSVDASGALTAPAGGRELTTYLLLLFFLLLLLEWGVSRRGT